MINYPRNCPRSLTQLTAWVGMASCCGAGRAWHSQNVVIFDDLQAEQDRLQVILEGLDEAQWASPSGAAGWAVTDVVLHLAQSEEAVLASATGASLAFHPGSGATLDEVMDQLVRAEPAPPARVFGRWRTARQAALAALRAADPQRPLSWVQAPLKPATLATTRLAEHWTHGLDITGPLGISFPDTARLSHIAWLAHRSLPLRLRPGRRPPTPGLLRADRSRWRHPLALRPGRRRLCDHRPGRGVLPGSRTAAPARAVRAAHRGPIRRCRPTCSAHLRSLITNHQPRHLRQKSASGQGR
jgi:uncharacterized protein (TIGR03083 family)